MYQINLKQYDLERKSERELKVWVQETVAPEIYEIACALEDRIDIWFSNLKKQIGITDRDAKITIRNRYLEIGPTTKTPKDLELWST